MSARHINSYTNYINAQMGKELLSERLIYKNQFYTTTFSIAVALIFIAYARFISWSVIMIKERGRFILKRGVYRVAKVNETFACTGNQWIPLLSGKTTSTLSYKLCIVCNGHSQILHAR